jgi:uncharacterized membrane protein YkvI
MSSVSLIKISSNVASELPFIVMLILFLRCASAYLQTGENRYAILAAALAGVACFQRYAGLTMAITGSVIIAYRHREHMRKALAFGGLFGLVAAGPILAWAFLHNAPANRTLLGARLPAVPTLNFVTGAEKVLYWFMPYRIIAAAGPLTVLGVILSIAAVVMIATGARRAWEGIKQPQLIPFIVFLLVYGAVLVFGISYHELKGIETDRVHIVILPPLLMVVAAVGADLLRAARRKLADKAVSIAAVALVLIWSVYPISRTWEYVRNSMISGDVSAYNSINKGNVRDSALAHYLLGIDRSGKTIYTNGPDTAWFILRSPVARTPWLQSNDRVHELEERFSGWPTADGAGYIVWLNAEAHKDIYATPAELGVIADVQSLYSDGTGGVYSVTPRQ